jgi:hypothetical protein
MNGTAYDATKDEPTRAARWLSTVRRSRADDDRAGDAGSKSYARRDPNLAPPPNSSIGAGAPGQAKFAAEIARALPAPRSESGAHHTPYSSCIKVVAEARSHCAERALHAGADGRERAREGVTLHPATRAERWRDGAERVPYLAQF